jgi:hypothetical protein
MRNTVLRICMIKYISIIASWFALTGVALVPIPLTKQFEEADATIIARAEGNTSCMSHGSRKPCVLLQNVIFLSKKPHVPTSTKIYVILDVGIRVSLASCCRRGNGYLMFLLYNDQRFYLYHGDWSILKMKGSSGTLWDALPAPPAQFRGHNNSGDTILN